MKRTSPSPRVGRSLRTSRGRLSEHDWVPRRACFGGRQQRHRAHASLTARAEPSPVCVSAATTTTANASPQQPNSPRAKLRAQSRSRGGSPRHPAPTQASTQPSRLARAPQRPLRQTTRPARTCTVCRSGHASHSGSQITSNCGLRRRWPAGGADSPSGGLVAAENLPPRPSGHQTYCCRGFARRLAAEAAGMPRVFVGTTPCPRPGRQVTESSIELSSGRVACSRSRRDCPLNTLCECLRNVWSSIPKRRTPARRIRVSTRQERVERGA